MARPQRVVIIGGGIGGVGLLVALRRVGIRAQLFERASAFREVGAGLAIWSGALQVLDALGVGDRIRAVGLPLQKGVVSTWRGRMLQAMDLPELLGDVNAGTFILHRADLLSALVEAAPREQLSTGRTCVGIEQDDGVVRARFADGLVEEGDVVVGADGLHSVVRTSLFGESPIRYSGQTCYRGIASAAPPEGPVLHELQGPGKRGAICPLDDRRVYWWAAFNAPAGEQEPPEARQARLLREYEGWPAAYVDLIRATPTETILRNDLVDRTPIQTWSRGQATLLGDAAHPTTPNLGQGACMALEDGLVLARALDSQPSIPAALAAYESARTARTSRIVRDSWAYGVAARWRSPAAVWARELVIRATPKSVLRSQVRWQFGGAQRTP